MTWEKNIINICEKADKTETNVTENLILQLVSLHSVKDFNHMP